MKYYFLELIYKISKSLCRKLLEIYLQVLEKAFEKFITKIIKYDVYTISHRRVHVSNVIDLCLFRLSNKIIKN